MNNDTKSRKRLAIGLLVAALLVAGLVLLNGNDGSEDSAGTIAPAKRVRTDASTAQTPPPAEATTPGADAAAAAKTGENAENASNADKAADAANSNNVIKFSDTRLKRAIHRVATLRNGMKLYSFQYLWSNQTYLGVMAQDLLATPEWRKAVILQPSGFYAVDYTRLGLNMATLEDWQKRGVAAVEVAR